MAKRPEIKIDPMDEFFGIPTSMEGSAMVKIKDIYPFKDHPFKVQNNEEKDRIIESVRTVGVLSPGLARPLPEGGYELISGHRRMAACRAAGLTEMPVVVREMTDDEAIIAMVDANLQREHVLPSEKAFAYKMKYEAMKHQGTSRQDGTKLRTDEELAENAPDSARQIQRYIRLTCLLPELLGHVDVDRVALTPAVYLSYLSAEAQGWVLEEMERSDCTPSVAQAYRLKEQSVKGSLTREYVAELLCQEKANQKERLKIPVDRVRKYFPSGYTNAQMEEEIVKMCEARFRKRAAMER